MARPAVIEELFAMIGDEDDQRVIENSQIAKLAYQRLETPIVVLDLSVVAIDGALDPLGGIQCLWRARSARPTTAPPPYWRRSRSAL